MLRTTRWLGWGLLSFGFVAGGALVARAQVPVARQVAAPASDILSGVVRLPEPSSVPTVSRAAQLALTFVHEPGRGWTAELDLPVDRRGPLALALLSPDAGTWSVFVGVAGLPPRPIAQAFALERHVGAAGDELPGWVVDRYDIGDAPAGTWTVRIDATDAAGDRRPSAGWLIVRPSGDLAVETYVATQRLVTGEPIAVVARARGNLAGVSVESARLVLASAGREHDLAMQDDGRHEDALSGDGLFGALVPPALRGRVSARVELAGSTSDGERFVRTAALSFPILERRVTLDGSARARLADERHLAIEIGALPFDPLAPLGPNDTARADRYHVSAEVWGLGSDGLMTPVCWLSRQTEIEVGAQGAAFPLTLDTRWLDVADAVAPLELRQVRAQDPDTEVVFDLVDRIALATPALPPRAPGPHAITPEMLTGSTSLVLGSTSPAGHHVRATPILFSPALMLVHGYCSGGSIWPAADFTQPKLQFLDPSANRTHDQFAQLLAQQAQAAGLSSFGVVAHSQGGCAALHLFTYYVSGLDFAVGARRIQALATPFQGTPLASWGGFACGVNDDMTPAGSAAWLSGIPTWARAEVYYWTTSNSGSVCSFFPSLLLEDPEDGTVEQFRGQLPSGNNMGHTVGWCHTTGMSNPASYTDHARNLAMNAAAAR